MPQLASHHDNEVERADTAHQNAEFKHAIVTISTMPGGALRAALQAMNAHQLTGFVNNVRLVDDELAVRELSDAVAGLRSSVSPSVARAVQATENVFRGIEGEFGLLKSSAVSELLGASKSNREFVATRRKNGELLGVERNSAYLYPGFQFDRQAGTIHPWVRPLLETAEERGQSATDVLFWMVSPSTLFEGDRPVDHLGDSARLVDVAQRAWGVQW